MLEQLKKVKIEDLGLKSDVEAIEIVKKLKSAVSTIGYYTDGKESYIVGDFEEIPLYNLIAKQRLDELEQEIKQINEKIELLQQQLSQIQLNPQTIEQKEPTEEIAETIQFPPFPNIPLDEEPKPLQPTHQHKIIRGFTFKKRESKEEIKEEKPTVPLTTYSFRCPNCNNIFTVDVPKNKHLNYLKCKICGYEIYKRKRWLTKKKAVAIACLVAFIIWLMT